MDPQTTPVLLQARDLEFHIGSRVILDGVALAIHAGERVGLLGRNGCGKSTLLRLLAGDDAPDRGDLWQRRDLRLGYLPQQPAVDPEATVRETILAGAGDILAMIARYEAIPHDSPESHHLEHRIEALGGWDLEVRCRILMERLQVPDAERRVASLSGGERRRTALCRALIGQPDLLLLDEPTNHLDTTSIEWLEETLCGFRGACLVVTHDRVFLDRVATRILELAQGQLAGYEGNYSAYLEARAAREELAERAESKRQAFLRRELEWIRRGPKARTTKSQSRVDRFYDIAGRAAPERSRDVDLVIPPAEGLGDRALSTEDLAITIGERTLCRGLTLTIKPGDRIGVIGPNGCGKTTLLRVLTGELAPSGGSLQVSPNVRFNIIDQHRLQLNDERTVLAEIADGREHVQIGAERVTVWTYLRRFLFTDDRILTRVGDLSGGERSRLLMAKILKDGGNFLVLDEPTNDLDLTTLQVLETALADFDGCALVVSHDRFFLNRVCTGILAFESEGLVFQEGDYDYYHQKRRAAQAAARAATPAPAKAAAATATATRPRVGLSWKEQRELEGIEPAIAAAEAEVERLEGLFCQPDFHARYGTQAAALAADLEAARAAVNRLYERWSELETRREG
ncbi:MAG: ABC-F family ATP-binding cassette domain-containing protein [Lentisphaerae bacterium]|nr:ABC-F family ATP-binding cassette domain-containing protein [Lentisphaerota bacterium]